MKNLSLKYFEKLQGCSNVNFEKLIPEVSEKSQVCQLLFL